MEKIIIQNKQTNYHIVTSKNADECTRFAGRELQKYLYKATLCAIPLFSDKCEKRGPEIFVGNARKLDLKDKLISYDKESFLIKNVEDDIIILGNSPRGTLYGVYYFLDKYLRFRKISIDTEIIDKVDTLYAPEDEIVSFPFEYRDVYFTCAFNGDYAAKNYLNSTLIDASNWRGGKEKWYNFHHSFSDLVPQDIYFDTHPEYYSLIDGKRQREHAELCLSNDDVFKIALAKVFDWIDEEKDARVFSVAQDEWMGHFEKMACECENCKKIDDENGSQSGSIITFVNKIAKEVKKKYPNKLIHTFAYQFSRKPPKKVVPDDNVIVRLTNIECSWAKSLEEGAKDDANGRNALFIKDLEGWSKITNRLYIWDYAVNYHNYLLPFPNLNSMYKNILYYKKLNVKGLLMEGNFSNGGNGYLDELKSYLASRLMSFDDRSLEEIVSEFCDAYYGKASTLIQDYINLFENNINGDLWLYDDADSSLFTDELVKKAGIIINKIKSIKESEKIQSHIDALTLTYDYLVTVRLPLDDETREEKINKLFDDVARLGITELFERTSIEFSKEVIRKSRYAKDRSGWYSLYYIMK